MSNVFIKFDGINGSTTAKGYENWSYAHYLHFQMERNINTQPAKIANREGQIPVFSGLTLTKDTDTATNQLLKKFCSGSIIPKVEIHVCHTGQTLEPYEKYILHNVLLAKFLKQTTQNSHSSELLKLDFTKVEHTFLGKQSDSSRQAPLISGYDLKTAEAI